jgi:diguanylate cyclase (GGDEF)-like protein
MKVTHSRDAAPAVLSRLSAVPGLPSLLLLVVGLALVFALDHGTSEAPVQHLYYIPLIFAALRFGASGGLISAAGAISLYHLANIRPRRSGYDQADLLQILIFAGVPLITAKLAGDARRLRLLASTDDLTGLSNLRGFEHRLATLMNDARASAGMISMLVLDVDRLKSLNDTYGHLTGADAVRTVGRIIAGALPPGAAACRYGGDEFAIAVCCNAGDAMRLAETIVQRVRQTAPMLAGRMMPGGTLSVSIGVASRVFDPDDSSSELDTEDGEALFRAADHALYVAKANGKGRTAVAN